MVNTDIPSNPHKIPTIPTNLSTSGPFLNQNHDYSEPTYRPFPTTIAIPNIPPHTTSYTLPRNPSVGEPFTDEIRGHENMYRHAHNTTAKHALLNMPTTTAPQIFYPPTDGLFPNVNDWIKFCLYGLQRDNLDLVRNVKNLENKLEKQEIELRKITYELEKLHDKNENLEKHQKFLWDKQENLENDQNFLRDEHDNLEDEHKLLKNRITKLQNEDENANPD